MTTCQASWDGGQCDRAAECAGLCGAHYNQQWSGKPFRAPRNVSTKHGPRCGFDGCGRPYSALGLCRAHYQQHQRQQILTPLKNHGGARENTGPRGTGMPAGWNATTPTAARKRAGAGAAHVPEMPPNTPTPALLMAQAHLALSDLGASDLLDVLGLTPADIRAARTRELVDA